MEHEVAALVVGLPISRTTLLDPLLRCIPFLDCPPAQVFFYIDPAFLKDPAMDNVKSVTLSYTFFRTGDQEVIDIANEILKQDAGTTGSIAGPESDQTRERIRKWTQEVAKKTGVASSGETNTPGSSTGVAAAVPAGVVVERASV